MQNRTIIDKILEISRIISALQTVGEGKYPDGFSSHEIARYSEMSMSSVQRTLRLMRERKIVETSSAFRGDLEIFQYSMTDEKLSCWLGKEMFK